MPGSANRALGANGKLMLSWPGQNEQHPSSLSRAFWICNDGTIFLDRLIGRESNTLQSEFCPEECWSWRLPPLVHAMRSLKKAAQMVVVRHFQRPSTNNPNSPRIHDNARPNQQF